MSFTTFPHDLHTDFDETHMHSCFSVNFTNSMYLNASMVGEELFILELCFLVYLDAFHGIQR